MAAAGGVGEEGGGPGDGGGEGKTMAGKQDINAQEHGGHKVEGPRQTQTRVTARK